MIHTHVASWNAGFTSWVGNLFKIPTLCKAAYLPPFHEFGNTVPLANKWKKWRTKTHYIALLPEMAKVLHDQGVPAKNIHITPNGVSVPLETVSVELNNSVLYVGNFSQGSDHKAFDILLKAWSIVCRELPDSRLVIAGGGNTEPWEEMAKELGCIENTVFLGHVSDLQDEYKKSCLFVLPSRGEGMSNALLEAQSYGIPAVVSDIPGNREIVIDLKTGLVVPVDDYEKLAAAVCELIRQKDLRQTMGGAARENCIQKYSIVTVVEQVKRIYARIETA
ncbi:glycosyltransferase family 4 protein [Desulforhopalus sp. 52FAK]